MSVYEANDRALAASIPANLLSDEHLVATAQAGATWAIAELCTRHSAKAFQMIYRVTRNREDAEDALQDAVVRAFRKIGQFDGRSSFATWFTRIGINSALMILRKQRIRQEISMSTVVEALELPHRANPEQFYVARERSMRLRSAVRGLPETLRSVIELRQMEGHSLREIANTMGISIPAAKSRLSRAKAELRKTLL